MHEYETVQLSYIAQAILDAPDQLNYIIQTATNEYSSTDYMVALSFLGQAMSSKNITKSIDDLKRSPNQLAAGVGLTLEWVINSRP